jgi:hypothetical protein
MTDDQLPDEFEKRATMFEEMAAQIRLNRNAKFGGAFLIIPPGDGEPFSSLMLNQEEQGVFWGALKSLVEMAMNALETLARQRGFR